MSRSLPFLILTGNATLACSYLFNLQTGSYRVNARTENVHSEKWERKCFKFMEQNSVARSVTLLPLRGPCLESNNFCPNWHSDDFSVWGFWHRQYETAHYCNCKLFAHTTFLSDLESSPKTETRKASCTLLTQLADNTRQTFLRSRLK